MLAMKSETRNYVNQCVLIIIIIFIELWELMIELSCFPHNLMFDYDCKCNKTKSWFMKKASFYEATLRYNSNYSDFFF